MAKRQEDGFDGAEQQAVTESMLLLEQLWARWCGEHAISPAPTPVPQPAVTYLVGLNPDELEWVALVRFEVQLAGQRWSGLVRGPADDVVFRVQQVLDADTDESHADRGKTLRFRWRRRQRPTA